jgi:hypothetical protein
MSKEIREQINKFKDNFIKEDINKDINHNLEVAKPNFLYFITNMDRELSEWIQYNGVEIEGSRIMFKFKSSQNSLSFKIYGGVNINNIYELLMGSSDKIYEYFKTVKYDNI